MGSTAAFTGQAAAAGTGLADVRKPSAAEELILRAFDEQTEIEFVDTPLRDAVQFIAEQHNIQIVLDEIALNEAGIAHEEPINLTLSGITLRSAMSIMFKPMGLASVVEDEVLKVTTRQVLESRWVTRIYDVRVLSEAGVHPETLARVILRTVHVGSWRQDVTSVAFSSDKKTVQIKSGDETIQVWDISGDSPQRTFQRESGRAAVESVAGFLIVSQTEPAHQEIADFLDALIRSTLSDEAMRDSLLSRFFAGKNRR